MARASAESRQNDVEAPTFCADCRFWRKDQSQRRRYAPQPTEAARSIGAAASPRDTRWPAVDAKDWGGEFQPCVASPSDRATSR